MKSDQIDLVILCGGRGSRLKSLTKKNPKPLLKIDNKDFLSHLVTFYQKYNFENIFFLSGYLGKKIKKKFDKKLVNFINCSVLIEKKRLGTGGALSLLKGRIKNNFLLINGDSFVNYNLNDFLKEIPKNFQICMGLVNTSNYDSNSKLSSLSLDNDSRVIFKNKSKLMNGGVYLVNKTFLKNIKKNKNISLENDLLQDLIKKKKIIGKIIKGYFIDIGLKENLKLARLNLKKELIKPAVFFDRDGVINYDYGYVHKIREFKWRKGVIKALRYLNKKNYYIFIVTNQSGIARNYYSEKDFIKLHRYIKSYLSKNNIYINDVKFCPHHPTHGIGEYKKKCSCRKPQNRMIESIKKNWIIDWKNSFMIGDNKTDFVSAKKSNLSFFYTTDDLYKQIKKIT